MGSSGKGVSIVKTVFDPGTTAINFAHKYTPFVEKIPFYDQADWLVDFAGAPREYVGNVLEGEEKFAQHKNWGGGENSSFTEMMRGMTEGQYYKEWDAYNKNQSAVRAEQAKARKPDDPKRFIRKREVPVASSLSGEEVDYTTSALTGR